MSSSASLIADPACTEESRTPRSASDLWTAYLAARSTSARDDLVLHYAGLVTYVASRMDANRPGVIDQGDLVQCGLIGLMEAISRFDPARGVKFETFAVPRIRGAVYDGLRKLDWVPRSIRSRARNVEKAISELLRIYGTVHFTEQLPHVDVAKNFDPCWTQPRSGRCVHVSCLGEWQNRDRAV